MYTGGYFFSDTVYIKNMASCLPAGKILLKCQIISRSAMYASVPK